MTQVLVNGIIVNWPHMTRARLPCPICCKRKMPGVESAYRVNPSWWYVGAGQAVSRAKEFMQGILVALRRKA